MENYKIKIDKEILKDFLLSKTITQIHLKELHKVVVTVLIKHYAKFLHDQDLESFATLAVLERKKNYNPIYDSYNFIYTICRNEIGNQINRLTKETFVEDILPMSNASVSPDAFTDIPSEIHKFKKYLTGEIDFKYIELKESEAVNLSMFILLNTKQRSKKLPNFIITNPDSLMVLYKLATSL